MALFDFGNITKKLQEAGEGLSKTVSSAAEKLPEFKPEELANAVKSAVQSGQNALTSALSGEKDGGEQEEPAAGQEKGEIFEAAKDITIPEPEKSLSVEDSLKIYYCLMAIDGNITPEEEQKYNQIGTEMDPEFMDHKGAFVDESRRLLDGTEDSEERYEVFHDYVSDIIRGSADNKSDSAVRGKLVLWNLYAIAYSDNEYTEEEKRLIRYICRALQVEKSVAAEMEETFRTLTAISNEEEWLKTTDRPYNKVEERLNELADRRQSIMQSVYALISD